MKRRSFLLGTSALTLSQILMGCAENNKPRLYVKLMKDSIPAQVVTQFSSGLKAQLKFSPAEQLKDLYDQLKARQQKADTKAEGWSRNLPIPQLNRNAAKADLVTLGDAWIAQAIQQKLIQPIDVTKMEQWSMLPQRWQELVTRNNQGQVDPQGKVWGVPYRWGSIAIVYRQDKLKELGWTPKDWSDLWREDLRGRISLLDQSRIVIGLVLKKLGKSLNTENLDKVPNLEKELFSLDQQVKFYSSTKYLEPLITGDTWLAVGWSSDIVQVMGRYPQLAAFIPQSGTALWSDVWVSPVGQNSELLSYQWMDFCLTSKIAKEISLLTKGNSPIPVQIAATDIQTSLRNLLIIDSEVLAKSEFLLPFSPKVDAQYQTLFSKVNG
ncbi:MAG: extracellular solute-binding protein [Scytonema sp. PMC 1069.18]|nr:extracellular solute-binding protein [Scytonema sp. PMC 1069.18]MEC4888283.1 extracellular solute-binding protein [Scytonema sp. PMC 1070.18]